MAVAQQLNFTWAAETLGVTAGAVSRQIRALEEYLGRTLLQRSGRGVALTEEGAELLPKLQQALGAVELAIDELRSERDSGVVRVTTLASFLQQWLLPRLPRFRELHPRIALKLQTSGALFDFARSGHHVGLRFSAQSRWPGLKAEKFLDEWLVPVCSPALLKKHGPVDRPRALARYALLHCETEPWSLWSEKAVPAATKTTPAMGAEFDASNAVVLAAARGDGLALARWSLVADEVAAGTLVVACSTPLRFPRSYWFVYPRRLATLPSVEAFRRWIFAEAAAFPPPLGADQATPIPMTVPGCH